MFSSKRPNYNKLRTNLRLCINRLKLMEKKKTELALKARKEIADYIRNGKEDRARIRVEHIIREDYLVEAMEIIEMFCDMLLARFGLIEKMKEMDPGLEDAIASIIWVTPRLSAECQELREVTNQFAVKYGKEFVLACQNNTLENVNEKVLIKLSTRPPPTRLVEMYMTEIAKSYDVPFEPDPMLMDDAAPPPPNLIDFDLNDPKNKGGGSSGGGGGGGNLAQPLYDNAPAVPRRSDSFPSSPPAGAVPGAYPPPPGGFQPQMFPPPAGAYPPPPQGYRPSASAPTGTHFAPQDGQNGHFPEFRPDMPRSPPPTYYPPGGGATHPVNPAHPAGFAGGDSDLPPLPARPPAASGSESAPPKPPRSHGPPNDIDRLPSYEEVLGPNMNNSAPAAPQQPNLDNLPVPPRPGGADSFGLPNVPSDSVATVGDEIDFDDLTKRFENLKKK